MGTPRKAGRERESATKEEAVKRTGERDWREEKRKEVEAKLKTKNSLIRCHHDTTINTVFRQTEHCWQLAGESVFFCPSGAVLLGRSEHRANAARRAGTEDGHMTAGLASLPRQRAPCLRTSVCVPVTPNGGGRRQRVVGVSERHDTGEEASPAAS